MANSSSESFKKKLKRALYERLGLVIMRGQIVLEMHRLSNLTSRDYIRVCSLALVAEEIQANAVPGSVAELGVYKGDFAKHINAAFPGKALYLFDTFQGFSEKDKGVDVEGGFSSATEDFSDTTVDLVLKKMEHRQNVTIRAGYFPDSVQEADHRESFAFVSIDTDLYKPIYDGLQFFYPRLSKGGYIFLHDYNNPDYPGVKAAVKKYCSEEGINCFPLVDPCGTAVITKG
ncbi:MAG TPA: TylF/MycF/NovP-related O-methyltransferase [Acidobacteriaceae bacterium]|jgi:O-methyltransferase|nr:TylF/MycF/NovP-related O-methyltransferase [Acidobacteriaceae bacterium]